MINYSDKINILKLIDIEKFSLNSTLDIQKSLNKQILVFMKNFIGNLDLSSGVDSNPLAFQYINESTLALTKSNSNIESLKKLISHLEKLETEQAQAEIIKYNAKFIETIDALYEDTKCIEDFIHKISLIDVSELLKNSKSESIAKNDTEPLQSDSSDITISGDDLNFAFVENTLVISESQKKVILPYKLETIKQILCDNSDKYSSMEDVISKLYTKPISYYKFAAVSRFNEAYKLIVEKEKGPKTKALSLASELFFNYNLHPAIITACKSLDELDIYLACLEDNTLEDFHFFNIKYEVLPVLSKEKSTHINFLPGVKGGS